MNYGVFHFGKWDFGSNQDKGKGRGNRQQGVRTYLSNIFNLLKQLDGMVKAPSLALVSQNFSFQQTREL